MYHNYYYKYIIKHKYILWLHSATVTENGSEAQMKDFYQLNDLLLRVVTTITDVCV